MTQNHTKKHHNDVMAAKCANLFKNVDLLIFDDISIIDKCLKHSALQNEKEFFNGSLEFIESSKDIIQPETNGLNSEEKQALMVDKVIEKILMDGASISTEKFTQFFEQVFTDKQLEQYIDFSMNRIEDRNVYLAKCLIDLVKQDLKDEAIHILQVAGNDTLSNFILNENNAKTAYQLSESLIEMMHNDKPWDLNITKIAHYEDILKQCFNSVRIQNIKLWNDTYKKFEKKNNDEINSQIKLTKKRLNGDI